MPLWAQPSISLDHESKGKYFIALRVTQVGLGVIIFITAVLGSLDGILDNIDFLSFSAIEYIEKLSQLASIWQSLIIGIATASIGFLDISVRSLDPWKWKVIQECLDAFCSEVFAGSDHDEDLNYKHRVTLYRLQSGSIRMIKPFWQKWLIPVARSGIITKRTKSIFRLHDNPRRIEGVVVQAFLKKKGQWLTVEDVPELMEAMTEAEKSIYRDKTNISFDKAIKMKYTARSYAAVRMEINGKPWGVLVLDSVYCKMPSDSKLKPLFCLLASTICPILEAI